MCNAIMILLFIIVPDIVTTCAPENYGWADILMFEYIGVATNLFASFIAKDTSKSYLPK